MALKSGQMAYLAVDPAVFERAGDSEDGYVRRRRRRPIHLYARARLDDSEDV